MSVIDVSVALRLSRPPCCDARGVHRPCCDTRGAHRAPERRPRRSPSSIEFGLTRSEVEQQQAAGEGQQHRQHPDQHRPTDTQAAEPGDRRRGGAQRGDDGQDRERYPPRRTPSAERRSARLAISPPASQSVRSRPRSIGSGGVIAAEAAACCASPQRNGPTHSARPSASRSTRSPCPTPNTARGASRRHDATTRRAAHPRRPTPRALPGPTAPATRG
jgi:hypothetical protein